MASAILEKSIQQVKGLIESRQFIQAIKFIKELESEYPSSAQLLVLKALVYARTGFNKAALSICIDASDKILADTSVLPDVLNTFQTICQLLGRNGLAITLYERACAEVCNNLDLMMGLFHCYVRESLFVNQIMISLKMYNLSREDKFLMWAVFSIQLQVVSHLVKKHVTAYNLDQPEDLLIYISVKKQEGNNEHAGEILSMLGTTLLIGEVGRQHIKGDMLLAHLYDYAAAMEILRQKSETSPGELEYFLVNLGRLLKDDSQWCGATNHSQIKILACKLSQLSDDEFGTELSKALNLKLANLPKEVRVCLDGKEYDRLDRAADEYFSRFGDDTKVSLRVSRKFEELQLINNLCGHDSLIPILQVEIEKFNVRVDEHSGPIHDDVSVYPGISIALKTNSFIILAADGKLTTTSDSEGLNLKTEKVHSFDDMSVGICGSWKTTSNIISVFKMHYTYVKNEGAKKHTISELSDFLKEELASCQGKSGVIFGAFEELKDGGYVPRISFVDENSKIDITQPFFSSGTGSQFINRILSKENINNMSLGDAICLVERALVYASECDSCTGGWANIHLIEAGKPVRAIARERICTTLWRRHHLSLP